MTTNQPAQDKDSVNFPGSGGRSFSGGLALPRPVNPSNQPENETFYFEEEEPDLGEVPFVAPFQLSNALPTLPVQDQHAGQASTTSVGPSPTRKTGHTPRFSLIMIAIIACVVLVIGLFVMNALAQTTPPLQTHGGGTPKAAGQPDQIPQKQAGDQQKPVMKPTQVPPGSGITKPAQNPGPTSGLLDWVPQQLPTGWTDAGLSTGDAIEALRTAVAFNDREMSLDYRSVGTRATHGGTFTAATFVLTPAAKMRFAQNDVRVINNTLFDTVANMKLIKVVVDPQPQLVKFAQQGQQQFAWVDVAFQLWQSQVDPNAPQQRIEGKDVDPATKNPRIHHMKVLLLHVSPQNQGDTPAMGGTGWLVSTYTLDPANGMLPDILQPA